MTDKILIDRALLDQVLDVFAKLDDVIDGYYQPVEYLVEAEKALRTALEQPDMGNLSSAPEGWKLVPVEPTRAMMDAYARLQGRFNSARSDWAAMLAATPQPPAIEQPQVEQEPVAWRLFDGDPFPGTATRHVYYDKDDFKEGVNPTEHFQLEPLYTHPQNLRCKSTQARLATLWGYEKPQPKREPLTDEQIACIAAACGGLASDFVVSVARAIEAAHGVKGRK